MIDKIDPNKWYTLNDVATKGLLLGLSLQQLIYRKVEFGFSVVSKPEAKQKRYKILGSDIIKHNKGREVK